MIGLHTIKQTANKFVSQTVKQFSKQALIIPAVFVMLVGGTSLTVAGTALAANVGNELYAGQTLYAGSEMDSGNGMHLVMQTDGNLVLYTGAGIPVWANNKAGSGSNNRLVMQTAGNLVEYNSANQAVWWNTTSATTGGLYLLVQTDGNIVIYNSSHQAVWSPNTYAVNFSSVSGGLTYVYNSSGIGHLVGSACINIDPYTQVNTAWCSSATNSFMWYGPFLTKPGVLYNFIYGFDYYWTDRNNNLKVPAAGDAFTFDITDNSGANILFSQQFSPSNVTCSPAPSSYCYIANSIYNEPINNLEMRVHNVTASNGDILHFVDTSIN